MLSNDYVHHKNLLRVSIWTHNSHVQKSYLISYFHNDNHYLIYIYIYIYSKEKVPKLWKIIVGTNYMQQVLKLLRNRGSVDSWNMPMPKTSHDSGSLEEILPLLWHIAMFIYASRWKHNNKMDLNHLTVFDIGFCKTWNVPHCFQCNIWREKTNKMQQLDVYY